MNSTTLSAKIKLSGCTDTKNTGGKGSTTGTEGATTGTIKWNGTGTTTFGSVTETVVSPDACPSPDLEYELNGVVTGGTGAAAKSIKKGWTEQAYLCINASGTPITISLLPGSLWEIGAAF